MLGDFKILLLLNCRERLLAKAVAGFLAYVMVGQRLWLALQDVGPVINVQETGSRRPAALTRPRRRAPSRQS